MFSFLYWGSLRTSIFERLWVDPLSLPSVGRPQILDTLLPLLNLSHLQIPTSLVPKIVTLVSISKSVIRKYSNINMPLDSESSLEMVLQ